MTYSGFVKGALLLVVSGVAATQFGCGTLKYNVPSSSLAPGADAKVVAEVKKNQHQTMLEVEASNLVPPSRVQPDGVQYVAWYRHDPSGAWNRIGTLDYDEDARRAIVAGSVPETAFDLQISVEPGILPSSPSPQVLFSQRVED
jgi:hypothetical protein